MAVCGTSPCPGTAASPTAAKCGCFVNAARRHEAKGFDERPCRRFRYRHSLQSPVRSTPEKCNVPAGLPPPKRLLHVSRILRRLAPAELTRTIGDPQADTVDLTPWKACHTGLTKQAASISTVNYNGLWRRDMLDLLRALHLTRVTRGRG